jgi:hypothetical protein
MNNQVVETKYDELERKLTEVKTKQEYIKVAPLLGQSFYHKEVTEAQYELLLKLCGSLYTSLNER